MLLTEQTAYTRCLHCFFAVKDANSKSIYSPNFVLLQCLLLALYLQPADSLSKVLPKDLMWHFCIVRYHMSCTAMYTGKAVVPDFVTRSEPDPLRDRSVLLGLLGQDPFDLEGFLRRLQQSKQTFRCDFSRNAGRKCPVVQRCSSKRPERGT